jgi:hypothetical protein
MPEQKWTHAEMIEEAVAWWEDSKIRDEDCRVIESTDAEDGPCLVVLHVPTGRTTDEAGVGGRWHLDGTACNPLPHILSEVMKREAERN